MLSTLSAVVGESLGQAVMGLGLSARLVLGALVFVTTMFAGGYLGLFSPRYATQLTDEISEAPLLNFAYGTVTQISVWVAIVVVVLVCIAYNLVIPLVFALSPVVLVLWIAQIIGSAAAFVAFGRTITPSEGGWGLSVFAGSTVHALLIVSGVGGLLAAAVGTAGFGAVVNLRMRN